VSRETGEGEERRLKNVRRMVVAMVEAGEVGALIKKIVFTVVDTISRHSNGDGDGDDNGDGNGDGNGYGDYDGGIDLYELSAETLDEAASQQSTYETGRPTAPGTPPEVDYMGCLYALHAASGDWRRCCHAMDYYGVLKLSCFVQMVADPVDPTITTLTLEEERELSLK
jgi:hypothetical protein